MQDLDPILCEQINLKFRSARRCLDEGQADLAIETALAAWGCLPEPKFEWDVSQIYLHALAGLYRDTKHFREAVALMEALFASGTVLPYEDGPYFVLGTIYYEMGDMEQARYWLGEANRISKGRCFRDQPEKYRNVVKK
jgi:tetratricopeptide (TPR) repeat protein